MSQKLFAVRKDELTGSGLFPSENSLDAPLWRDGRNVIFVQGGPQKTPGFVAPAGLNNISTASQIRGLGALVDLAAIQRLFLGTVSALAMWVAGTYTDVTRVSGPYTGFVDQSSTHRATAWSILRWGGFCYATNGVDRGQKRVTSGPFTDWTETSWARAEILLALGPHVLAFATDAHPGGLEFCSADDPDDWVPSSTNSAGFLDVREIDGDVIAAVHALGQIVAASKNQLYLVSYTGAPFYVGYQSLGLDGIGAVGKMAMVGTNRIVYGMSDSGIWETDGSQFKYIDTDPIRAFIQSNINAAQKSKACLSYDSNNETLWISFPGPTGENEWTLTYRIPSAAWGIQPIGRASMLAQSGVFLKPYMAGVAASGVAKVFQHNTGVDADGGAVPAYVRTKDLDCGDDNTIKAVDYVVVQTTRLTGAAYVRIGWRNSLSDDPADPEFGVVTWSESRPLNAGFTPVYFPNDIISGRFLTLEVGSTGVGDDFAITGFEIWGEPVGTYA